MRHLKFQKVSTATKKAVKKEYPFPAAIITPQASKKTESGVCGGSLLLSYLAAQLLGLTEGSTVTISDAGELIIYNSTLFDYEALDKKKLTKSNLLRISSENTAKIYSDCGISGMISHPWVFKLEEIIADDFDNPHGVSTFVFTPVEKRA